MRQRYFLIEPQYSDPDTFCHITVGSDRVRASIHIYASIPMFLGTASALVAVSLREEWPTVDAPLRAKDDDIFDFQLSVMPHSGEKRVLRCGIYQDCLCDGAPYRADIRLSLSPDEAVNFANQLKAWCDKPEYAFVWTD